MPAATITIGLDVGYGSVKACASNGQVHQFESITSRVSSIQNGEGASPSLLHDTSGAWIVGKDAITYGTPQAPRIDSSWILDDQYRVLSLHAINRFRIKEADLVLGLPVSSYHRSAPQLKDLYTSWGRLGYQLRVLQVLPQPVGTLWDVAYDEKAQNYLPEFGGRIGIVDIGSGTVDCIEMNDFKVSWDRRSSEPRGVARAHEFLYAHILERHKVPCTLAEMSKVIADGYVTRFGKQVKLDSAIADAKRQVLIGMKAQMEQLWGNQSQLKRIVFTGGGADFLRAELEKHFPVEQIVVPTDPALANARGYLKFALASD